MRPDIFPSMHHVAVFGRCYGNETDLSKCASYVNASGVKCKSGKAVAVECRTSKSNDLLIH